MSATPSPKDLRGFAEIAARDEKRMRAASLILEAAACLLDAGAATDGAAAVECARSVLATAEGNRETTRSLLGDGARR